MKVLMCARAFPKGHWHDGRETLFPEEIVAGNKIHTLRSNDKEHFKDGEKVSLRYWSGMPYRSKQVEFAQRRIGIEPVMLKLDYIGTLNQRLSAYFGTDLQVRVPGILVARHDGLCHAQFMSWFFPKDKMGNYSRAAWFGDILHFTDYRYLTDYKEHS